jgi:hypothetical protein
MREKYQNETKPQSFAQTARDSHAQCVKISRGAKVEGGRSCEFSCIFERKTLGIVIAKSFPEKWLTVKVDSVEFANCLPNQ